MSNKKYREAVLERQKASPYVKTNYRDTMYKKTGPQPIVEQAPLVYTKQWYKFALIIFLPLINIIAMFVWGFNKKLKINPNQRNFAKAMAVVLLLVYIIVAVAVALLFVFKIIKI